MKTSFKKLNFVQFQNICFVQECAGRKLYELYWAMKQQMEKGPQDALTLEARYSLSEEKLLRASFDFRKLTVFIAADHHSSGAMDYPVRVLDCDSITQVQFPLFQLMEKLCFDIIYGRSFSLVVLFSSCSYQD